MSSQQVTVKAYYNDLVEKQPEIRRFSLDISSNANVYETLEKNIAQLNSNYPQGQFSLQYIDEDGDRITFSSESELRSALNNVSSGGLMKIYVKPKTTKPTTEQQSSEAIHPGVTCDGCQGPVIGNRFKCTVCPDYDLCQACSDKKVHPDHNMIKITHPWQRFFGGHRRCGRGPFGGRPCGGPGRFWHRFMNQQAGGAFHVPVPGDITNFLSQYKGKELAELIEAHLPAYLRTEKINEMINQFKTGEQADKPIEHNVLLEHVGKFLQEILSPFGIDCDYFVDKNQQQQEKPSETKENQEQSTTTNNTSTEPKPTAPPASETASASASASAAPNAPSFGNLLDQLQTMFTPMFQQATAAAAATTTTTNTVDQQAEEEKKIAECVERMTAMGFVDSNGVLTQLIKSKNGDLNQVLDALNPRNYQN